MDMAELKKIMDSIQFPCVFLERDAKNGERIAAINNLFINMFGLDEKKTIGAPIESILKDNADDNRFKYGGENWVVKRTTKGKQVFLMLSPVHAKDQTKIEVFDSIDPLTGLYVVGFMKHKARSDIESIIRGKRRLSVALFRLSFNKTSVVEPSEEEKTICNIAFGRIVIESIRICDSAYLISSNEVLLLMPDTPSIGADKVILRIYSVVKKMASVECPSLAKARLEYAQRDFIGGTDLPQYDKILEEMTITLNSNGSSFDSAISA
jgi:hypothetical protein